VKGDRDGGEYRLLNLPYDRSAMGLVGREAGGETLALLRYTGPAVTRWSLPEKLKSITPLGWPAVHRTFQLGQAMGAMGNRFMGRGMAFTINGRTFQEGRVDGRGTLNTVEEWEFVNPAAMDHPMHIHTDPFQVIDSSGSPVPAWKDTVLVKAGSRLKVRTALRDYPGLRMFHCHILDHEDLGMMGTFEVHL
jgi:FtsP/CotA-like multicopper oxidase with cupredoxin domain